MNGVVGSSGLYGVVAEARVDSSSTMTRLGCLPSDRGASRAGPLGRGGTLACGPPGSTWARGVSIPTVAWNTGSLENATSTRASRGPDDRATRQSPTMTRTRPRTSGAGVARANQGTTSTRMGITISWAIRIPVSSLPTTEWVSPARPRVKAVMLQSRDRPVISKKA